MKDNPNSIDPYALRFEPFRFDIILRQGHSGPYFSKINGSNKRLPYFLVVFSGKSNNNFMIRYF